MRRVQFIELHEQSWFPSSLRDDVTDAVQFGFNLMRAYAPIAPLLQNMIDSTANGKSSTAQSIVDMCSGGGGPWLDLSRKLKRRNTQNSEGLQIWLTDKYPNLEAFQSISASSSDHIRYYPEPVDAMNVPRTLKGLRTMFTSFHHFSPDEARTVLQNAVDARQGIGVFEITRRAPLTILLMSGWVFLLFVLTFFIRPFRWSRLFWTYVIPVIPFVLWFDGVVSCLRTYRPGELHEIVSQLTAAGYEWRIGDDARARVGMPITYLIGYPD